MMISTNYQLSETLAGARRVRSRLLVGVVCLLTATAGLGIGAQSAAAATHVKAPHTKMVTRPGHSRAPLAGGPLINNGGPVQTGPRIYLDLWGWTSDPAGEAGYLQNFLGAVGGTSWLNTVSQYGAPAPVAPSPASGRPGRRARASRLTPRSRTRRAPPAAHFGVGSGDLNAQIVVATPTGHSTSGFGTSYCAYHGVIGGTNNTYTDLPYMPDAGGSAVPARSTGQPLDGVSIVEGHELAEAITDPLLNAWYDSSGAEIGDICAWTGLANVEPQRRQLPMQPLWSNATNACVQGS